MWPYSVLLVIVVLNVVVVVFLVVADHITFSCSQLKFNCNSLRLPLVSILMLFLLLLFMSLLLSYLLLLITLHSVVHLRLLRATVETVWWGVQSHFCVQAKFSWCWGCVVGVVTMQIKIYKGQIWAKKEFDYYLTPGSPSQIFKHHVQLNTLGLRRASHCLEVWGTPGSPGQTCKYHV